MRPVDHRDRTLYDHVWDRVYFYGSQLLERGYAEATKKPNLFDIAYPTVTFFASLRGTRDLEIWNDRRPIFWWQLEKNVSCENDVLARMVTIEAARLDPIPIRTTYLPSAETLSIFNCVESERLFDRPEPEHVPTAPHVSQFSWRVHMNEAIDGETDERVPASRDGSDRTYLRCPLCRERVTRQWDADLQRFFFDHTRGRCSMQHVW